MSVRTFRFRIDIGADEWLRVYQGSAHRVRVWDEDGRVIDFSAALMRAHVRHDGVHGRFQMQLDDNNRLIAMQRLSD
jgi:hypothetical protein